MIAFLSDSLTGTRGLEAPDFPFPIVDKGQLRGVFILSGNSTALESDAGSVPLGDRHRKRHVASMVAVDDHGPARRRQGFRINGTGSLYFQIRFESCQFSPHLLKGSYASACSGHIPHLESPERSQGHDACAGNPDLGIEVQFPVDAVQLSIFQCNWRTMQGMGLAEIMKIH